MSSLQEAPPAPGGGVRLPPTPEQLQSAFDHGIWYALSLWPALHIAVQNSWGGADSDEKRDWFAGTVSDLFSDGQETDAEDLEAFLLQIMQDEFDCNVEDDTEVEIVRTILVLRKTLLEGDISAYETLERRWKSRGMMKVDVQVIDNGDGEADDDDDEDDEMDEDRAPQGVQQAPREPRERPQVQVDDDGFTKVVSKKR
jgi:pre-rRNA-processing protein TSR2